MDNNSRSETTETILVNYSGHPNELRPLTPVKPSEMTSSLSQSSEQANEEFK